MKENTFVTYEMIQKDPEVRAYIRKGDQILGTMGFTDHAEAHATLVAERAAGILRQFGYTEREQEMVKIAGYMHDIGNSINRKGHAEYGALLAGELLRSYKMGIEERVCIVSAIANHDESSGGAFDAVSAALIIADKTDVRRNRVREKPRSSFDIHDRVNYAVTGSSLNVREDHSQISLDLQVDESICSMYDYFEIFLGRMLMCRRAAEILETRFILTANGQKIL